MSLLHVIDQKTRQHGPQSLGSRQVLGSRDIIPSPTKGLNTRDALVNMKPEYAVVLDNYFPDLGSVRLRKGRREYATGIGTATVESIWPHYSGDVKQFYAAGGGAIYDISAEGAVGAALLTGQTGNRWSHAPMSGSTVLVNGEDLPRRVQADGMIVTHGWTGQTDAVLMELNTVTAFKRRLYFTRRNSATIYYGPLNGVQGELTAFDVSLVAPQGGNVMRIGAMTVDSGAGIDDLFLLFLDNGRVSLYRGTNPAAADATGFFEIGRYDMGALVGDDPLVNVGGDLFAHTVDGIVSMSQMLKRGRSGQKGVAISETIMPSIRDQAALHGNTAGWGSVLHPPLSWLMFSAPVTNGEQWVMNTQTGAWARFRGMDARCWGRFQDKLYYGDTAGRVHEAGVGQQDGMSAINGDVQTAFNYLGTSHDKIMKMARPTIEASASVQVTISIVRDFETAGTTTAPLSNIVTGGTPWATPTKPTGRKWATPTKPTGNKWSAGTVQSREWRTLADLATAVSIRLESSTRGADISFYATDIIYEKAQGIM